MTFCNWVVMTIRQKFKRTRCGCEGCTIGCRTKPGYLALGDPELMAADADVYEFAEEHLVASDGAVALRRSRIIVIPTIVPKQRDDGTCVFFDTTHAVCTIHDVAPFGCSHFDTHMDAQTAARRMNDSLVEIYQNQKVDGEYSQLWRHLQSSGLTARPRKDRVAAYTTACNAYDAKIRSK